MFIFFDLDGTLVDHDHALRIASLAFRKHFGHSLPYGADEFPEVWDAILNKHFNRYCRGEVSFIEHRRDRMRELFQDASMSAAEADSRYSVYYEQYTSNWVLFEDVIPCLARLDGRPLGVITNGHPEEQAKKLAQVGIADRFQVVTVSGELGIAKPHPDIFREACRRAGVSPAECLHIGDSWENDVVGGRGAGLKTVWLNRDGSPAPDSTTVGIRSLQDFFVEDESRSSSNHS